MLKEKVYKEVSEELKSIKKVRKEFERQIKDVENMKVGIVKLAKNMSNIITAIESNQNELSVHDDVLIETVQKVEDTHERIKRLETKGEPDKDVMFR